MLTVLLDNRSISPYVGEMLDHAGLAWRQATAAELVASPPAPGIVVLVGRGVADRALRDWLSQFARSGGGLIAVGGVWGIDDLLGARETGTARDGYARVDRRHPITAGLDSSLHLFDAARLIATTGTSLGSLLDDRRQETLGEAIVVREVGQGVAVTIAVDIPAAVHAMQHGRPVHVDGAPAPDGTAPIDEGILKCDDGIVLSWEFDRERTALEAEVEDCPGTHPAFPAGDTPWFARPIADEWRAVLLQAIAWAAAAIDLPLPVVWPWPRGLPAVGLISHDSDFNVDAHARTTLRLLDEAGIQSTWCMMEGPTYPDRYLPETFDLVARAGHETALHYNALDQDGGRWGRAHLLAQAEWLRRTTGVTRIASNKNHFTRWEGDIEFFHWLEEAGIGSDQSKGPSKKGNVGFLHGSCQPWFPRDLARSRALDVLEIPLETQDLWWTTPYAVVAPILEQVVKHRGVAHFLLHQIHLDRRPPVAQALLQVVADGRDRGLEWWTSERIAAWERLRRSVAIASRPRADRGLQLDVTSAEPIAGFSVALLLPGPRDSQATATSPAAKVATRSIVCFNQPALLLEWDLAAGSTTLEIRW